MKKYIKTLAEYLKKNLMNIIEFQKKIKVKKLFTK